MVEEQVWKVVATGAAIAGAAALRPVAKKVWSLIEDTDPPTNPAVEASLKSAAIWTVLSGAALGMGRLVGQRVAAEGWRLARGEYPPGLRGPGGAS